MKGRAAPAKLSSTTAYGRETPMKLAASCLSAALALALAAPALAQSGDKISDGVVRIGLILDMSSLYADITGPGSEMAAKMAAEEFGGKVLGKPIEIVAADHF